MFYSYEKGLGYRPYLDVTYTANAPSIQSDAVSDIANTSARLNATVLDDGGESCQVRFGYGETSQTAVNFASYDTITDWSVAIHDTAEHPYIDVTSLTAGTTYYYRAQIKNSGTTATSSSEITFDTTSSLNPPTNIKGYPDDTEITLSYVKGSGSSKTLIRYSLTTYPTTTSGADGTTLYEDTASSYTHTGLHAGKTYYYAMWGESGGVYSATNSTKVVTTNAFGIDTGNDLPAPVSITRWFQDTDYTQLSKVEPLYSTLNGVSDAMGIPRDSFWKFLAYIITAVCAIGIMIKKGFMAGMVVGTLLMIGASAIHILPMWSAFIMTCLAIGAYSLNARGRNSE
jgi:hypothetical protein